MTELISQNKKQHASQNGALSQSKGAMVLQDNRSSVNSMQEFTDNRPTQLVSKPNNTGLPNQLKAGIESLSGISMDQVKVHYNSSQPAQLNAQAYAQGSEIHLAPGQEKHLPHEAWHVVQQAQGRVKPTVQMKRGAHINDDAGLEKEADVKGATALQMYSSNSLVHAECFQRFSQAMQANSGAIRQLVREAKTPAISPATKLHKTAEGHAANPIKDELLEHKGFRKLNRLSGQINKIPLLAPVATALNTAIVAINGEPNPADYTGIGNKNDPIRLASITLLNAALVQDPLSPKEGDELLLLGTLEYWATNEHPDHSVSDLIERLRLKMQQRSRMSIVAHRGMGATNKSFGGLIPDTDPARSRFTENSQAAFTEALSHAATPDQPWGLDGIECDVFLSQDGVPIVSHDGNISEQMSAAKRAAFANPHATIGTTDAAVLLALERKQAGDAALAPGELPGHTVFMSLAQLLALAAPVAAVYAAQHHKGFRFEIEMKGSNEGVHNIVDITAKTVSKFKKGPLAAQAADLEIVMFNGDANQVGAHVEKRKTKTKLGGLVVGLGAAHPAIGPANPHGAKAPGVDEYRMSLANANQVKAPGALTDNYLSTYVLGGEQEIRTGVAPTVLEWGKGPELQTFLAANANSAQSINQLWQAFQVAYPAAAAGMSDREFKYPMGVEKKRVNTADYRAAQAQLHVTDGTRTHLLTDYPEHVLATRTEMGPEGDRMAAAIQHLLKSHDWMADPTKGNKNKVQWEALLAAIRTTDTFNARHVRANATEAQIIEDLGQ